MRIFIMTLGTRGDLELFLTLGRMLRGRGHQVLLGTSPFYGAKAQTAGLDWSSIGLGTYDEHVAALQAMTAIPDRVERIKEYSRRWLLPQIQTSYQHIQYFADRADYFINNLKIMMKRANGQVIPGAWLTYDPPISEENRKEYDALQPDDGRILNLVALNKQFVDPQDQWGERYHFTGFWTAEGLAASNPALELLAFLQAGPAPVVLTMGSMVMFDPYQLAQKFAEALRLAGQRGIIVGGWSGISLTPSAAPAAPHAPAVSGWPGVDLNAPVASTPPAAAVAPVAPPTSIMASWGTAAANGLTTENVLCVAEAPYEWLFPLASCVIHHGGCGTLAAVLRAGIPSILLPQIPPQEIFGRMLERAKLATGSLDVTALDPRALAEAIRRATTDPQVRQSCREWQAIVAQDPGLPMAIDLIEEHGKTIPQRPAAVPGRFRPRDRGGW